MPTCDEQLLSDYASQFLGYGSLNSCVWLIGPEAGGGRTIDDAQNRASVWAQRGRKETEDLQGYHSGLNRPLEFDWKRNIQMDLGAPDQGHPRTPRWTNREDRRRERVPEERVGTI